MSRLRDDGGSIDRSIDTRSHVRHANYIPADSRAYVRARVAGCVRAPAKQKLAILEKVTIPSRITRCLFPRNAENPCLSSFQFHHDQSSIRFSRDSSRFSSSRERRMPRVPFARELFFRAPAKTTPIDSPYFRAQVKGITRHSPLHPYVEESLSISTRSTRHPLNTRRDPIRWITKRRDIDKGD